jgi:macrodomain Ter protein organizer (MatP/YcbG family)
MKSDPSKGMTSFDDLPVIDPAVDSILGEVQRRQMEARLPKNERSRRKKERERAEKRKPNRINLDLPVDLKKRLEHLAKKEGVPVSQLVAFLLYEPVHQLESRAISLWGYKTASGCPKFECTLDLKRRAEEIARKT